MADLAGQHAANVSSDILVSEALAGNATEGELHEPTDEEMQHSLFIFYTVMFVMIFAQSALVNWRKRHRRSYELVTLVGLWLIPPIISLQFSLWRFLTVCILAVEV